MNQCGRRQQLDRSTHFALSARNAAEMRMNPLLGWRLQCPLDRAVGRRCSVGRIHIDRALKYFDGADLARQIVIHPKTRAAHARHHGRRVNLESVVRFFRMSYFAVDLTAPQIDFAIRGAGQGGLPQCRKLDATVLRQAKVGTVGQLQSHKTAMPGTHAIALAQDGVDRQGRVRACAEGMFHRSAKGGHTRRQGFLLQQRQRQTQFDARLQTARRRHMIQAAQHGPAARVGEISGRNRIERIARFCHISDRRRGLVFGRRRGRDSQRRKR